MADPLIPVIPNGCYVYEVLIDGMVRYVGKGTGRRFKNHITTAKRYERYMREGRSQITVAPFYEKLLLQLGRGADISYRIVQKFDGDQDALSKEIEHIASFPAGQLWNDGPGGNGGTSNGAFKRWANPAEREAHRKRLSEVWANPALIERHRELTRHRISNFEYQSAAAKARWSRPGEREAMSAFAKKNRAERTAKKKSNLLAALLSFGA
jgi:hypothetical protein